MSDAVPHSRTVCKECGHPLTQGTEKAVGDGTWQIVWRDPTGELTCPDEVEAAGEFHEPTPSSLESWIAEHGTEVQVAFVVPVEVVVDLRDGTVSKVVTIDEAVVLDRDEGVRMLGTLQSVGSREVEVRAARIADHPDVEWPRWEAGW